VSFPEQRAALVRAGARLAGAGLVVGGAGNASVRVEDRMVITPRGSRLAALRPEELLVCDLDGRVLEGDGRASSETPLHCAAYAATGAGAVVHTHPVFCSVVSTLASEIDGIHYAVALFGGSVRVADYATFGSPELAEHVATALRDRRGALMRNHGAVTVGDDLDTAVELAETLEWLASVHYHAHLAGTPSVLSAQDIERVQGQRAALGRREPG
jgi:L-fuculose-phosphate aldolase